MLKDAEVMKDEERLRNCQRSKRIKSYITKSSSWSQIDLRAGGVKDSIGTTGDYLNIGWELDKLLFYMKEIVLDFRIQTILVRVR